MRKIFRKKKEDSRDRVTFMINFLNSDTIFYIFINVSSQFK